MKSILKIDWKKFETYYEGYVNGVKLFVILACPSLEYDEDSITVYSYLDDVIGYSREYANLKSAKAAATRYLKKMQSILCQ